jgi:hypothetical protein
MNMNGRLRLIVRLLLIVTGVYVSIGLIVGLLLYFFLPAYYFHLYPLIPLFFYLVGLGMALSVESAYTIKPATISVFYMVARGVKLLMVAIFLIGYAFIVHDDIKPFGFTTLGFYVFYLVLENLAFYKFEKRLLKNELPEPKIGKEIENEEVDH